MTRLRQRLPGFEAVPRRQPYQYASNGCNLYLEFCWSAGIHNPFIPKDCSSCIWQRGCEANMGDPDGCWERVEYPEHFWWRFNNLPEDKRPLLVTPDGLDQFYPEPDPTGMTYRCNRCLSTQIDWQPEWIVCKSCGWSEPLHDYPVARRY